MSFGGLSLLPADIGYSHLLVQADPGRDHVAAYLSGWNGIVGNTYAESIFDIFSFSLEGPSPIPGLGNEQVDLATLSLDQFDPSNSRFEFQRTWFPSAGIPYTTMVLADLGYLRVTAVPEPPTYTLLLTAIGVLSILSCRAAGRRLRPSPPHRAHD